MRKPLSALPLYVGFLLWGVGAVTSFANRQSTPMTYTLILLGLVCILIHYCIRNIEARLASIETSLERSRSTST
jgi:ABC-type spermidine/putrescine transport system permease subunit II